MKNLLFWDAISGFILLLVLIGALASQALAADPKPYAVDGDTLALGSERIRVLGIDTPESYNAACDAEEAAGTYATGYVQHLLNTRRVTIIRKGKDKYGRTLAEVAVGKDSLADLLIAKGIAVPYDGRTRRVYWVQKLCPQVARLPRRGGYFD